MKGTKLDKINVLAFAAHPDDVEACAGGLLIKAKRSGLSTGIVEMTRGEASNFGSKGERDLESKKAAKILNLDFRANLDIPDSNIALSDENLEKMVTVIRIYKPDVIVLPYFGDLHPGHAATGLLGEKAAFFAKIQRFSENITLPAHQPTLVMYYMLHTEFSPSFVLDISEEFNKRLESICAHTSQFFLKKGNKYTKQYHNKDFMDFFEARCRVYGYKIGVKYGEPFLIKGYLGLRNITDLMSGDFRSLTSWKKK